MYGTMANLHRIYNYNHSFLCGYSGARLFFTPVSLVAVKPKNGDSYLYRMGFGITGKDNEVSPYPIQGRIMTNVSIVFCVPLMHVWFLHNKTDLIPQ